MHDQPKYIPLRAVDVLRRRRARRGRSSRAPSRAASCTTTRCSTPARSNGERRDGVSVSGRRGGAGARPASASTSTARRATAAPARATAWSCAAATAVRRRSHHDRLRSAPVGHFFDVITNGFGAMPDYAAQIPADGSLGDRRLHPRAAVERSTRRSPTCRPPSGAGSSDAAARRPPTSRSRSSRGLQRRLLLAGARRRRRVARRRCSSTSDAVLPVVPDGLHAVPRRDARLPRARHGPPAVGRRLGRRHPPADRRGDARRCR